MELLERAPTLHELALMRSGAAQGVGRLALVTGEAGIGKTTLVRQFCDTLPGGAKFLWGRCDEVKPPRPFAPLSDVADQVGGPLRHALNWEDRNGVFAEALRLLRRPSISVFVIEDLHSADEATLDLIRVLGHRLDDLRVLMIGTYRDHDVRDDHPLRAALGDLPAGRVSQLQVPPLSVAAVATLARGSEIDPVALHAATSGNPFFVTEVIAAAGTDVPSTVRDAVIARTSRMSEAARHLLRVAAVHGPRSEVEFLQTFGASDGAALIECLSEGMLQVSGSEVTFRHELARRAVQDAIAPSEQAALHRRVLEALTSRRTATDPAMILHHAIGAGDSEAVLALAPLAAAEATRLGANREAVAHYRAALRFAEELTADARADLLESYAGVCLLIDDVSAAITAQQEALTHWREIGDSVREGNGLQALSMMYWVAGDDARAVAAGASAVELLEAADQPAQVLARAYASLAQRHLVAGDDGLAKRWALRALALSETTADEAVAVHAMTTLGVARIYLGEPSGWDTLEESVDRGTAAGLAEVTVRALINLVEAAQDAYRYDLAERYVEMAETHLDPYDLDLYDRILRSRQAELDVDQGRWDAAVLTARELAEQPGTATPVRARALTVLGRIHARRGDQDPWTFLDQALAIVAESGSQERCPVHAARAEAAWIQGDEERARVEVEAGLMIADEGPGEPAPHWFDELRFWAWKVGSAPAFPADSTVPFALHTCGHPLEAAEAWRSLTCPYHEALALGDSGDADAMRHAVALLHDLGAVPLARRFSERLRASGASHVPRGPRPTTLANPARLTRREVEVLAHMSRGLRNAEIAEKLVVSPKTIDHHVSAVLRKLGVPDRAAAAREAVLLGIEDGDDQTPR